MLKIKTILEKYNLIILFGFMLLTMQTYIFHSLQYNTTFGVIYRGVIIGFILCYSILFTIAFKVRPTKVFIVISIVYFISSLISLIVNPLLSGHQFNVVQYLTSISTIVMNILSIYVFLSSYKKQDNKQQLLFLIIFVSFVTLLCFYTYIFQYKNIYETLTNKYGWNYDVTSIFYIKTIYGYFLTMGSIFSVVLNLKTGKKILLLLPVFFLINAVLSRNKTSMALIILLMLIVLAKLATTLFKQNKRNFYILLGLIILFVTTVAVFIVTIPSLKYFVNSSIINDGSVVMKSRFTKWGDFFGNINNGFNVVFGYGERLSNIILGEHNVSDNIYLLSFASGGLIKLGIHLILIILLLKEVVKSKDFWLVILISIVLLSGLVEENYIYGFNITSLVSAPLLYKLIDSKTISQ